MPRFFCSLLALAAVSLLLVTPAPVLADDELDEFDEDESQGEDTDEQEGDDADTDDELDDELEEEVDNEATYQAYQAEVEGESAAEELDAWNRYLEAYPQSIFRLEIEQKIQGLEDAAFQELAADDELDTPQEATDAKYQEMEFAEPAFLALSPNTRRKVDVGVLWGFQDHLNYELMFEWAFFRRFSAFGSIRHDGHGFGAGLQAGAKYALLKDVRTGVVLSGAFSVDVGYSGFDGLNVAIQPWIGFGWLASEIVQLQTSLSIDLRLDRFHTWVIWDAMVVINPKPRFGIFIANHQKHSILKTEGVPTQYLGFHQAGVGVKLRPIQPIEITVGANIPYAWRLWKDYRYFGAHADLTFYFKKGPK
ncbi:MAG TPA: hypothetical protein DIU15_10230 [Deltaproteobacteria bacterium]|nr:hypothetical protein [Deltaproteobacteria bacterium]HCP46411.1 hypothetical protein [Deltaproteobacteria bacterium]